LNNPLLKVGVALESVFALCLTQGAVVSDWAMAQTVLSPRVCSSDAFA